MKQPTLLEAPKDWTDRLSYLKEHHDLSIVSANLLLQVELAFSLMEILNLDDEPVSAVWAVLSKGHIPDTRLKIVSAQQRRAWANARQLVPYPEKFNWLNALRDYQTISATIKMYIITDAEYDSQSINGAKRKPEDRETYHEHLYETWLTQQLPYHRRNVRQFATKFGVYECKGQDEINIGNQLQVEERTAQLKLNPGSISSQLNPSWLPSPTERTPFKVDLAQLGEVADFLDQKEQNLIKQLPISLRNWRKRLKKLRCRVFDKDGNFKMLLHLRLTASRTWLEWLPLANQHWLRS